MMKKIIIVISLFLVPSISFAQNVDQMWKARALQAGDNIKMFEKEKDTLETRLKTMVEFAYAMILVQPDIVVKKTPAITTYHLVFNFGSDGMLDVVYVYDSKTEELIGARVDRIPKNRAVLFANIPRATDYIVIANYEKTGEPMLFFHKTDPFRATAAK